MATADRKKIGKYDVLDVIGRGGMGIVYKAADPGIGRAVAIKMMTGAMGDDPEMLKRFNREAQSVGKLQHPNIVTVYELGVEDGNPYLVMELLDGESLDSLIRTQHSLSLEEKLEIVIQICDGVQYAHQRNVTHRDIKPANIMILKDGTAKIVDFGIAQIGMQKLTRPGQMVGSFQYMSPEQINAARVDSRTDIFSIGVLLFELVAGQLPFEAKDTGEMLLKIIHDPPPPLTGLAKNCPPELDEIVGRALAKDPQQRYQTAEDLALDLGHVLEKCRGERVSEYLQGAETAAAQGQWTRAKELLLQVLKRDRQNPRANVRLREVQMEIQKQQGSERAKELLAQAEHALAQSDLDEALTCLNEAAELDSSNLEIVQFRDSIQEQRTRDDQLRNLMRRAELAQDAGDVEEAGRVVEQGLALDPQNTDFRSMQLAITQELMGRDKQKRVQEFLGEARKQISSRRFTAALEVLRKAESVDPSAAAVKELMALASTGQQQEQRRQELERLTAQIQEALVEEDYKTASARIAEGLGRYPEDRGLLKLQAVVDKQRAETEQRSYIEQQTAQARKLLDGGQAADALILLRSALEKHPSEPSLEAMVGLVQQTIDRTRKEQEKTEVIQNAREAIRRKAYSTAISILEAARKKTTSSEFDELLQFAQNEAENQAKRQKIDAVAEEARRLTSEDKYPEAIALLKATLQEIPDQELQIILADIERQVEEFNAGVEKNIATADRLLRQDRYAEAIKLLEGQSTRYGKAPKFRQTLENIRQRQQAVHAVSVLKEDVQNALSEGQIVRAQLLCQEFRKSGKSPDFMLTEIALVEKVIAAKQADAANARLEMALRDARLLLTVKSLPAALSILESVESVVPFAAPEFQQKFEALQMAARDAAASGSKEPLQAELSASDAPVGAEETQLADPDQLRSLLLEVSRLAGNYRDDRKVQSAIHNLERQLTEKISLPQVSIAQDIAQDQDRRNVVDEARAESSLPKRTATSLRPTESATSAPPAPRMVPVATPPVAPAARTSLQGPPVLDLPPRKSWMRGGRAIVVLAAAAAVVLMIGLYLRGKKATKAFPPPGAATELLSVHVHTSPPGATIQINNEVRGASDLLIDLPAGSYQVEANLNGYQPAKAAFDVSSGSPNLVDLTLQPALPVLKVSSDTGAGKVTLDNSPPIDLAGEQRVLDGIATGDHKLTFRGPQGSASFSFSMGTPPTVQGKIAANRVLAVVVGNVGSRVHVYCSQPDAEMSLDGQQSTKLSQPGVELQDVATGPHDLLIQYAGDQYKLAIEVSQAPTLTTFLESGKNIGTLVVVTHEDGVKVFVNGKAQQRLTRDGQLRIPNLVPKEYVIAVDKPGFQETASETTEIRKGEQSTVTFGLKPVPRFASLSIRGGYPGTQVLLDDKPVGTVQADGTLGLQNILPGDHAIALRKDHFVAKQLQRRFIAGSEIAITGAEAVLMSAAGELRIIFSPTDAQVILSKSEPQTKDARSMEWAPMKVASGASMSLPPGTYTLTARIAGDITRTKVVEVVAGQSKSVDLHLAPSGMAKWDDPSGWIPQQNAYVHKGGGFVLFSTTPTSGTFSFSVMLQKGKRLQWVLNYTGPKNYTLFQMDENYFYRSTIRNGEATKERKIPHKTEKAFQTIRIRVTPYEIVHQIKAGDIWFELDKWSWSGTNLASGKFGFYLPGEDEIAIMNFHHYGDLDTR
jgi:eukaryotic-like serine/threonine-protein kinase